MIPYLLAAATAAGSTIVTLSGSSGSPNLATATVTNPGTATAGWKFQTDGDVQRTTGTGAYANFNTGVEWINRVSTHYIRATLDAGLTPDNGPTLGVWHVLTTEREWTWERTAIGSKTGTLEIDIATDSGGTNIVANGFYRGTAEIDSGS